MKTTKSFRFISSEEYKGVPVQRFMVDGKIMYHSCSTWFEDFAEFAESVDDSIKEEGAAQESYNGRNDFMDWLVNPARRNESATQMLTAYAITDYYNV